MRFAASLLGALRLRADSESSAPPPARSAPVPRASQPTRPAMRTSPALSAPLLGPRPPNAAETAAASAAGLRGAAAREAGVIGWYRGQLLAAHAVLAQAWVNFDNAPEAHYDTRAIRAARRALRDALHDYYAASGGPSPHAITHVLADAEESDRRIAALDHELVAEVRRLEVLARDVATALAEASDPAARATAAADADDALIELELYRESCVSALDVHTAERLDHAQSILKSIVESSGGGSGRMKESSGPRAKLTPTSPIAPEARPPLLPPIPRTQYAPISEDEAELDDRPPLLRQKQISYPHPETRLIQDTEPRSLPVSLDREPASSSGSSSSRRTRGGALRIRKSNENGVTAPKRRRPSAFLFGFGKQEAAARAQQQPPTTPGAASLKRKKSAVSNTVSNSMRSFWGLVRPPAGGPGGPPAHTGPPREPEEAHPTEDSIHAQTSDGFVSGGSGSSSSSTTESGEELPSRMVMSRTRTLRDVAESARHLAEEHSPATREPGPREDRQVFPRSSGASFSATLYHTNNARAEAISDAGVMLTSSKVVGDGRCLFRSVARGRAVARGEAIPKPHAEKKAADRLRARSVTELRKHKALLLRFYVIEDNFDNYIERMSQPRTYGGEPELLMLAKILRMPIAVYLMLNGMYRRIQLYGKQYQGEPIRIRYCNDTHYDALIPTTYRRK